MDKEKNCGIATKRTSYAIELNALILLIANVATDRREMSSPRKAQQDIILLSTVGIEELSPIININNLTLFYLWPCNIRADVHPPPVGSRTPYKIGTHSPFCFAWLACLTVGFYCNGKYIVRYVLLQVRRPSIYTSGSPSSQVAEVIASGPTLKLPS